MKLLLTFTALFFAFCLFFPSYTNKSIGIAENLYTYPKAHPMAGIFYIGKPGTSPDVLNWERMELGITWNWFVLDRGIGHPAWQGCIDLRVVLFYLLCSFGISLSFSCIIKYLFRKKFKKKII